MNAYTSTNTNASPNTNTNTSTNTTAPVGRKLSDCVQLVRLSIGMPNLVQPDKQAAKELAVTKHAKEDRLSVYKKLVDSAHMREYVTVMNELRVLVDKQTTAYARGERMLVNERIIDTINAVRDYFNKLAAARDAFLQEYPAQVAKAQLDLGDAFDENLYPSVSELYQSFHWSFDVCPFPDNDVRGCIEDGLRKELAELYEQSANGRLRSALDDLWRRLVTPLKNMSKQLTDKADGKPTKFHNTLVHNVLEVLDVMQTYSMMGDTDMDNIRQQLRAVLDGVTYEQLKLNATLRAETKAKIDDVLKAIDSIPSIGW